MKIGVISDIHGNLEALEAVLEDIKEQGCEKIFMLGDYAMAGPNPKETVDKIFKMQFDKNISMIQGNTDLMLVNYNDALYEELKQKAPVMAEALRNDVMQINPIQKNFLKELPIQLQVEEEGVKILLVHGSPRKNNEDIHPNLGLEQVEEMIKDVLADVVLCGHTHIPCGYQTASKKSVVNVGSVGRPFTPEPKACYLKLTVTNGKCIFEHRFVEYNKELSASKLSKRSFDGAEKLAEMLLNPTVRHF